MCGRKYDHSLDFDTEDENSIEEMKKDNQVLVLKL